MTSCSLARFVVLGTLLASLALGCHEKKESGGGPAAPEGATATKSVAVDKGARPPRPLTAEECRSLAGHVLDVAASEALDEENVTPEERKKRLAELRAELASDPELKRDAERCDDATTRRDYDCILRATTTAAIDRCQGVAD